MLFCRHYFSPLNTFMRKGKDPNPHFWLMDPDPKGPKICGSCRFGSGSESGSPTLPVTLTGGSAVVLPLQYTYTSLPILLVAACLLLQGGWKLLWDSGQSPVQEAVSQRPRIFSPPLQQISFPTRLLRQAPANRSHGAPLTIRIVESWYLFVSVCQKTSDYSTKNSQ